ncbi:MAG: hypothetical protein ACJ0K4_13775 [Verrucomicrobiales bacterium]
MLIRSFVLIFNVIILTQYTFALPEWIWVKDRKEATIQYGFNKELGNLKSAKLRIVSDYANVSVILNDELVGVAEGYGPVLKINVLNHLVDDQNKIILNTRSTGEAPAVALTIELVDHFNKKQIIATSADWKPKNVNSKIISLGNLGVEKWWNLSDLLIDEVDDYTQWKRASKSNKATDPSSFQIIPGYEVELLRSALPEESSWVNIAFDSKGRITVAREDKGLIRYSLSNDSKKIVKVEKINDDLKECRGLLYAHESLYVHANNSKSLYRLEDKDRDGTFETSNLLHMSEGGFGHGRNDLALGPEGKIYAINGDSVNLPEGIINRMSPLRNNHLPSPKNEGHVIRMDSDGKNKEIFCAGLRNPYGIDFNEDGEAFTYDADAEFDMGTPWYRPTQIKHLTSGADFGWRAVTGKWPPYYPDHPDNAQHSVHIGKGSPTGIRFGTNSNFPQEYKQALYALDWAYGRILAVHFVTRGSTYMGASEVFLRGKPLNVTDLDFGPDGSMYFVTGGRKTKSGLYRVSYIGKEVSERNMTLQEKMRNETSREHRQQRKQIEKFHERTKNIPSEKVTDPRIRYASRISAEHNAETFIFSPSKINNSAPLEDAIPDLDHLTAKLNIASEKEITKLIGADQTEKKHGLLSKIMDWEKMVPSKQLEYIDIIRRLISRHKISEQGKKQIIESVGKNFPYQSAKINMAVSPLLIELDPDRTVPKVIEFLKGDCSQREGIHYLFHLRKTTSGWSLESREIFFRILAKYETLLGGRGLPQALKAIRKESTSTLTEKEKEKLSNVLASRPSLPEFPDRSDRTATNSWTIKNFKELLNFNVEKRNLRNGKKVFELALCSRCHQHGKVGYPIGPDLTNVANRFGREDLLREILLPSNSIAENYQAVELKLRQGSMIRGQVIPNLDYRVPYIQIAENSLYPDKITKIDKANIIERSHSRISLMPSGLLNLFTIDEIVDLLAWLESPSQ